MDELNEKLHQKVDVMALRQGMFVAALDRDWLGTTFELQGFLIRNGEQLAKLREYCQFVYVDPANSTVPLGLSQRNSHPVAAPPQHKSRAPFVVTPRKVQRIRRGPLPDLRGQSDPTTFRQELEKATRIRARSHDYLKQVFEDVRLGSSVNTEEAQAVVTDLVDTITVNVNASLWLTNLRNKDEYTSIHSMNVCILSIAFGRHLGLGNEELKILGLGALLHDIGKINTPIEVLNKPGKLTPDEYGIMKRHPVDGDELVLSRGDQLPPMALTIIRHHHERLGGTGYPDRWSKHRIPLQVLITSVVDTYDAVTSDRCYHDGLPAHWGLQLLYDIAPKDFGHEIVEEFIRCVGIYPIGSLVELTTGELGIVLSADVGHRLKPLIQLLRAPDGTPYEERRLVNLADRANTETNWGRWGVRKVVDPSACGIDIKSLVGDNFSREPLVCDEHW